MQNRADETAQIKAIMDAFPLIASRDRFHITYGLYLVVKARSNSWRTRRIRELTEVVAELLNKRCKAPAVDARL